MKIVEPPKEVQNIKMPSWTSIKVCYSCTTKCKLDPDDIDQNGNNPFTRTFFLLSWITHFWECPVCKTLNNFHSYSYDTFLYDMEIYKKLLQLKRTVAEHLSSTSDNTLSG